MEMVAGEVVGVGRRQVVGVRVVVYVWSNEKRGYPRALWYFHHHVFVWGGGVVVAANGHPPHEVGEQPGHCVVSECGVRERSE